MLAGFGSRAWIHKPDGGQARVLHGGTVPPVASSNEWFLNESGFYTLCLESPKLLTTRFRPCFERMLRTLCTFANEHRHIIQLWCRLHGQPALQSNQKSMKSDKI